jgi:hypothetical protein
MKRRRQTPKKVWTGAELRYIRDNWEFQSDARMANHFGVSLNAMVLRRRSLGLKRPLNTSRLLPPKHWNAHKKGQPFWVADHGKKYLNIMVYETGKPRRLMRYARYVWMQANGEVPKGKMVAAINGDINDTRLENLVCCTRAEMASMMQKRRPEALRKQVRAKQIQTLRRRKMAAAYLNHQPYEVAPAIAIGGTAESGSAGPERTRSAA